MGLLSAGLPANGSPTKLFDENPINITKDASGTYIVDFGRVAFGNLRLTPFGKSNGSLTVHFGEALKNGRVNRKPPGSVRYQKVSVTPNGESSLVVALVPDKKNTKPRAILTPKEWGVVLPFRWVEIEGWQGELSPKHITRQAAYSATWDDDAASFESSDAMLNKVWELCRYSIKATTFAGVYVDGDRERIPYEADAYLNQLSHYYTDNDIQMARDTFDWLMKHPTWPTEWAHHMIFMAYADWMHTGDKQWLEARIDSLKSKLLLKRLGPNGLLTSTKKHIKQGDIVDWPTGERDGYIFKTRNTVVNAFYIRAAQMMSSMALALGKKTDAGFYDECADKALKEFQASMFDAETGFYRDGVGTNHKSLHGNLFPLAFNLTPDTHRASTAAWLAERGMRCSVYVAQYYIQALFENGRGEDAIKLMLAPNDRSWRHMVESGTTITWEAWDQKYKWNQDWNHAWGAAPANLIPRYILGVQHSTPGWETARISPKVAFLDYAKGQVPTPRGPIKVVITNKPGSPFELKVEIPAKITADVEIPLPGGKGGVLVNGRKVKCKTVDGVALINGVRYGTHTFRTTENVLERIEETVTIVHATYGSSKKNSPVTKTLKSFEFTPGKAVVLPGGYNKHFGDPHHKTVKQLTVQYVIAGKTKSKTFAEGDPIFLD